MGSQQVSVLHWMNNLLISKFHFTEFHIVFAFQKLLAEVTYLLIRFRKTKFFPWNTKNTNRKGTNKQNTQTHAKHFKSDNIWKG